MCQAIEAFHVYYMMLRIPWSRYYYNHFKDENSELDSLIKLPKVTHLANDI